jgi:phosphoribosylformylglycinamidine cyclo-ligase
MDYREAGVDIPAADAAKRRIKALAAATFHSGVLSEIGSFGALFRPDLGGLAEPVLVSSADGVGTKIKVAILAGVHDTVGYDLVAHCVNDILVQGARPLFFLDYLALGRLEVGHVESVVAGVARACAELGCPLVGGETAQMPDIYAPGDYDLAGFIVGIVDRARILPREVAEGDVLLGLAASGLHTNGYSLARRVLFDRLGLGVHDFVPELGATVGQVLLAPHRPYHAALAPLLAAGRIRALAHITGGGFPGNLPRVLPAGLGARLRRESWRVPPIFRLIQQGGDVSEAEMYSTFNMGMGMVAVVAPAARGEVLRELGERGETACQIGTVVGEPGVVLE